jgi:hypothetical protein
MLSHELSLCSDVGRRQMREFCRLSFDPAEGLKVFEMEVVFW